MASRRTALLPAYVRSFRCAVANYAVRTFVSARLCCVFLALHFAFVVISSMLAAIAVSLHDASCVVVVFFFSLTVCDDLIA